jgi:bifunctional non-homologous end joining protein LigD
MAKKRSVAKRPRAGSEARVDVREIFDAAAAGDFEKTQACIDAGADVNATDRYGFTALHRAASAEGVPVAKVVAVMRLLLEAGSSVDSRDRSSGRTPLFLAAEFAMSVEPIQLLLDAGADPTVSDGDGVDIVSNARSGKVKRLLSSLTGVPVIAPVATKRARKVPPAQWARLKRRLNLIFRELAQSGLVALQNAGTTQSDGFSDCSERYRDLGGKEAGLRGFCFYTGQDLARARETGGLTLAYWGAPRGSKRATLQVGQQIVDAFRSRGFVVDWDQTVETRPTVDLHSVK